MQGEEAKEERGGKLTMAFDPLQHGCIHVCSYLRKVFFWETSLAVSNWTKVVVAIWVYLG